MFRGQHRPVTVETHRVPARVRGKVEQVLEAAVLYWLLPAALTLLFLVYVTKTTT
jgi:hypothetical protein